MTYRDTEDALRARIQALESKLSQRARERIELQQELARARQDLAALHPTEHKRPTGLLMLGVVGCSLVLASLALARLVPSIGYSPWLFQLLHVTADIGLGLGLLGFYFVTRQRLALAATVMLFVGLAVHLLGRLAGDAGQGPYVLAPGWLLGLATGVVLGLTLLRATDDHLQPWKRNLAGVSALVGVLFGTLSFVLFMAQISRGFDGSMTQLYRYISIPSSLAMLGKQIGLLLCFLELRRPLPR